MIGKVVVTNQQVLDVCIFTVCSSQRDRCFNISWLLFCQLHQPLREVIVLGHVVVLVLLLLRSMLSLIRRQPIFYPRQVGCVIRFRRLRFLLRVASSPRIAALPSWRVHPTRVCVLRFHRIDGLSFRTCEHHLPDCYDLQQGVSLFRLHNCWELQVLLFHLICRWGWAI